MMDQVRENIIKHSLIGEGDNVLLGLSGGPDSVFLFHMLLGLKDELGFKLFTAHLNHGVRGEEATRDQEFARHLSESHKIPFYLEEGDMDGYARDHGLSKEEAGRKLRYDFFNNVLKSLGGGKIALGHNKEDQVETLLMRFFRGTGIDGLRGIEYRKANVIRPMLNIARKDLVDYLDQEGLDYKIDRTNLEKDYTRNRIRLETIPHIEENYNPNLVDRLFETSHIFKEDSDFLREYSEKSYETMLKSKVDGKILLDRKIFLSQHRSIQARVLRLAVEKLRSGLEGLSQKHISDSLDLISRDTTGKMIDLMDGLKLMVSYDDIALGQDLSFEARDFSHNLSLGENYLEDLGIYLKMEVIDGADFKKSEKFDHNPHIKYFDYDKINRDLSIRNRRSGDVFHPLGMKGRKKLKDFFIDQKIPRYERDRILLLVSQGQIIWVVGYRTSEKFKVTEDTEKILKLEISRRI